MDRGAARTLFAFQAGVAVMLVTLSLLPALGPRAVPTADLVRWSLGWSLSGVAMSAAIGLLLARLDVAWTRGLRAVVVLLPAIVLGGAAWSLLVSLLAPLIGTDPFVPPNVPPQVRIGFETARGASLLGVASSLLLVNLLSLRVQRAREQSAVAQAAANEAQLQLLRGQVNPHFLFNALNSVVALTSEDPRRAREMVRDIATLLRRGLDADTRRETSVREELDFVRLYLKCEGVRFEERLQASFDIDPAVEPLRVPPMLLQPLVENAVKHGTTPADGALVVTIAARKAGGRLTLEVSNTGTLEPAPGLVRPEGAQVGLRNLKERLAQLFPGTHAFELAEREGRVHATLSIPVAEAA